MKLKILIVLLAFGSTYLNAYVSSGGDEYTIEYNKHGAILTSVNVKHFIANDASVKRTSKRLKLYLSSFPI